MAGHDVWEAVVMATRGGGALDWVKLRTSSYRVYLAMY